MKNDGLKLTKKEEEIMELFWERGAMFIRDLHELYDEPRPHFNTLSTVVRGLQARGFIGYTSRGGAFEYFAVISKNDYSEALVNSVVDKYFTGSAISAVSALVKSEKISAKELQELIDLVNKE